jgi:hypothetical protein
MKHWKGNDVLYIGDHIYGDLAVSHSLELSQWNLIENNLGFIFEIRMANRSDFRRSGSKNILLIENKIRVEI